MLRIDDIHAFISVDDEGEGIIGQLMGDKWIPFVCADHDRVESLKKSAATIARLSQKEIKLVRFSTREEIDSIKPGEEFSEW